MSSRGLELLRRRGLLLLVASILAIALDSALVKQTPNYIVGRPLHSVGPRPFSCDEPQALPVYVGVVPSYGVSQAILGGVWGGLLLWFGLPVLFLGAGRNSRLLGEWLDLMTWDQTRVLEMLDVGSFLTLHLDVDPAARTFLAVSIGLIIGLGRLALFRRNRTDFIDRFLLPINGLYVLLFSYLSESPTSVLATAGIFLIAVEALSDENRSRVYWILWVLSLVLIPVFYTDLVPKAWGEWARGFHLKTVGYVYVTIVIGYLLYRRYPRPALAGEIPAGPAPAV